MTEPAKIESKKEKELALYGRTKPIPLYLEGSRWEDKQVRQGKRKVRFEKDYYLDQFEQEKGYPSIFKDPNFFENPNVKKQETRKEIISKLGNQKSSFFEQENSLDKWNGLNKHPESKHLLDVFEDLIIGDENLTKYQKEQIQFAKFKEKYINEFDRLDGFRYKYRQRDAINENIRNENTYERIIAEEEPKAWKPFDEPQTNPPEQLKEFLIEPNILVNCKNILDIDHDYKKNQLNAKLDANQGRRQAQIGLTTENLQGYQLQMIAENKNPNEVPQEKEQPKEKKQQVTIVPFSQQILPKPPATGQSQRNIETEQNAPKQMTLAESILYFQQQMKEGEEKKEPKQQTQVALRKRELFDFMFDNPASLPFSQMNKIARYVEEKSNNIPKLSEADQILYDNTPMIPTNIFTHKSFFRLKEAEEYEREMKIRLKAAEKPTAEQIKKEQAEIALKKEKAQFQINNIMAAMNPINYQFTGQDIKGKTILTNIEEQFKREYSKPKYPLTEKAQEPEIKNEKDKNKPSDPKASKSNINIKPSTAASSKDKTENTTTTFFDKKEKGDNSKQKENDEEKKEEDPGKQKLPTSVEYGKFIEVKTIQELNQLQSITPQKYISETQKKINNQTRNASMYIYDQNPKSNKNDVIKEESSDDDDGTDSKDKAMGQSGASFKSGIRGGQKNLMKNDYYADYGSHLTNVKVDYNIPPFYHKREAEQGLFYLSKNYRDYFEPARDVFAEKDGWDILDAFAHNPKNSKAVKPSVHTYGEAKKDHSEEDILTAIHGLKTMNEYNQLVKDIDSRNEQNFQRRIHFNQVQ